MQTCPGPQLSVCVETSPPVCVMKQGFMAVAGVPAGALQVRAPAELTEHFWSHEAQPTLQTGSQAPPSNVVVQLLTFPTQAAPAAPPVPTLPPIPPAPATPPVPLPPRPPLPALPPVPWVAPPPAPPIELTQRCSWGLLLSHLKLSGHLSPGIEHCSVPGRTFGLKQPTPARRLATRSDRAAARTARKASTSARPRRRPARGRARARSSRCSPTAAAHRWTRSRS